ncbi:N-acyl-D-amino-acid deacylase family protein [Bauldia sp.]|uniref:N-acyl-D-amino-acid deacylase family protein n=1 Tax=Bauldia sp. TaxID=2575872 RepID=UPI003BA95A6B
MNDTPNAILIRSGDLVDGTGAPRRKADVLLKGERIAAIAEPGAIATEDATVIDATGLTVSPGFIDVHTHDDNAVLVSPDMSAKLSQGVTTVVAGNCGISIAPGQLDNPPPPLTLIANADPGTFRFERLRDYAAAVEAAAPSINIAMLIGHSTLRIGAMDDIGKKANTAELDRMRERLAACLDDGAIGFSTGLYYKTNAAADMEEVVALAELLADKGGVYVTHMRDEHDHVLDSLHESFETANKADVPIVISHHKCAGPRNWGRSRETLPLIEATRAKQRVGLDAYPYAAGSTVLDPDWIDPEVRTLVSWSISYPEMSGRDLADIAAEWRCSQQDAARRLSPAGGIYFQMDEADVRRILAYPPTMIGSDGLPHDSHPHPRLWGTFPRVLGKFCREEGLFSLEDAVYKMTGLSASRFGLTDRGVVREGAYADLVLFDADEIIDRATFEEPTRPAHGIDRVFVNGKIGWQAGAHTGARSGRFVSR